MTRLLASTLLLSLVAACTPDFDEVWDVQDLRLLAIRAEAPEVLVPLESIATLFMPDASTTPTAPFPTVRVDTLVVDPREPDQTLRWQAIACTPEGSRCEDAALSKRVFPADDEQWATTALDDVWFDFTLDGELASAALQADPFRGFGGLPIMIEIRLQGTEEIVGVKRLVYGVTGDGQSLEGFGPLSSMIGPLLAPEGKQPNRNPKLSLVKADDEPLTPPWKVEPGKEIVLLPESPAESKERYIVKTFSKLDTVEAIKDLEDLASGTKELDEYLSYAFFSSSGALSHAKTGGRPSPFVTNKKVDDLTSTWTAPLEAESGTLWVVVRDDRGGVDWLALPYEM